MTGIHVPIIRTLPLCPDSEYIQFLVYLEVLENPYEGNATLAFL